MFERMSVLRSYEIVGREKAVQVEPEDDVDVAVADVEDDQDVDAGGVDDEQPLDLA